LAGRVGTGGVLALTVGVIAQTLLEATLGRLFVAPNVVMLVSVYLAMNHGDVWAVESVFIAGLALDMLLHQPPGASSLALLCGMAAATGFLTAVPRESRSSMLAATAVGCLACDAVFFLAASRPAFVSLGGRMLLVFPRALMTVILGSVFFTLRTFGSLLHREHGA
jgi:hypothetical protein